jgi:flavodoxin
MKTCIIYHSYSGITRGVAEKVRKAWGGDLVEVQPKEHYSKLTAYTLGCLRARKEDRDPIIPEKIDVSSFDLIVIGTPVWAWKATPAINAAIAALEGCEGKSAVIFATCGSQSGDTLPILRKALESKGVKVAGEIAFTRKEIGDDQKIDELIALDTAAGTAP